MKTPRRNKIRSDRGRTKRVRLLLNANPKSEPAKKAIGQARFQEEGARAWIENAGVGGVEDLYSR